MSLSASNLIWAVALGLVTAIVLGYLISFRRRNRRDQERAATAQSSGRNQPIGAFPYIDPSVCIGCGGCVAACPEKVLGIVGGLAVAIQGSRCVGIASCAKACPVQAIEIAIGDLRGRADVPWMTDTRETNVPGIYVAGELGGLALIRNAVHQGAETVRAIAKELAGVDRRDPELLDLAIIGAGPAGLAAALAAVESGLRYAVFEQQTDLGGTIYNFPRRKLTHTEEVELPLYGPLRKSEYSKEELLELFRGLLEKHRLAVLFGQKVLQVIPEGGLFHILTVSGAWRARRVLLALGRRGTPRTLGVPGEQLPKVMYQVRDAEEYRGKKILCVGGGDSAIEAAMGLARQAGNHLTLSYRGEAYNRVKAKNLETLDKLVRRGKIRPLLGSEVLEIGLYHVRLRTTEGEITIDNNYVFVLIGGEPPFPFLRSIGVLFGDEYESRAARPRIVPHGDLPRAIFRPDLVRGGAMSRRLEPLEPHDHETRAALLERLNAEDLPSLAAFLAGYLHEDWQLEFTSPGEAAFAFAGSADLDDVEELASDWSLLVEVTRGLALDEINRLLHQRFGCAWQVTSKSEIEAVGEELERALRE